jgi:glutamate-1-semialdehyde 2,1-aminomutase
MKFGQAGARVEPICARGPLRTGAEAAWAHQPQVERVWHLALLNRGSLIAPFHDVMLISPATRQRQIGRQTAAFNETLTELAA